MPNVSDWVWVCAMLMQAMIGSVSSNVRMITLEYESDRWNVSFYLEQDDLSDREDAEDIVAEFGGYFDDIRDVISQQAFSTVTYEVIVTQEGMNFTQNEDGRIIFRRRESGTTAPRITVPVH